MQLSELSEKLLKISKHRDKIDVDSLTLSSLGEVKNQYLGAKSELAELFKLLGSMDSKDRAQAGKELNVFKQQTEQFFSQLETQLIQHISIKEDTERDIDLSAPYNVNQKNLTKLTSIGNSDPITQELINITDIFRSMGFNVFEGRELDTEYYIFDSLGFPKNHPARENWDAFKTSEGLVPTPHTSNMQVRIMRLLKEVPMRAVIYGRCFRNEAVDAVHGHTFYQVEGVYVDKGVTVSNMIATIKAYLEAFFEQEIVWRIQPAYFPFVEPGIEFMIRCVFCNGKGCSSCKHKKWLEVAGAGMIHPVVLREGGIDPEQYSGFAWGLGVDRVIMQKNGIKDIRSFFSSDIRFLKSKV